MARGGMGLYVLRLHMRLLGFHWLISGRLIGALVERSSAHPGMRPLTWMLEGLIK